MSVKLTSDNKRKFSVTAATLLDVFGLCERHSKFRKEMGGRISSLVVFVLAVHSVAGSILLWGNFPVEGIFPLELTWVQTPFPQKLFRMRV